ncbi:MAG: HAD family hydrolase [SAR202 cluster bacterium]|nr:HAD family hydrolase [SAR202 cluster bacterium]
MKIFFDCDYTILGLDDTLRPGTLEIFQRLKDDSHEVFLWSGMGERWEVVEKHKLEKFLSGVYAKPTNHFHEKLAELKVPFEPDFVIDDYPEIVAAFGGVWVPPYFFKRASDQEMERVYRIVSDFAASGTSPDKQYRAKGTVLPLF